ncbi:MAG TPA: type II toxin-antitoxin system HicA family toxin [Chloroflexota bacterium]|nr:type II toxin-antitoxin system HicA family toxin [Chloroflexota bacterium]
MRHLTAHGCVLVREGAKHSVWRNAATGQQSTIPRHRQIPLTTARAICQQLGVPAIA